MAIIWEEDDNTRLEAMKYLETEKGPGHILFNREGSEMYLKFRVLDKYKATLFFSDLLFPGADQEKIEDITGVRSLEVGGVGFLPSGKKEDLLKMIEELKEYLETEC